MWKEVTVTLPCLTVMSRHSSGETEEKARTSARTADITTEFELHIYSIEVLHNSDKSILKVQGDEVLEEFSD